eukprot:gene524-1175_t
MDLDNNRVKNNHRTNNIQVCDDEEDDDCDIPSCLIVTCVPDSVFANSNEDRNSFESMFAQFGTAGFVYLKSFRRVLINYQSPMSAALAKLSLHFTDFKENELKVYFKKTLPESASSLQLPKPEKQFLISPPASPPVGWEPLSEAIPVVNYDLLTAVAGLSEQPHELHPETPDTPGIVVHTCEDPVHEDSDNEFHPLKVLPRDFVQTSRPPMK